MYKTLHEAMAAGSRFISPLGRAKSGVSEESPWTSPTERSSGAALLERYSRLAKGIAGHLDVTRRNAVWFAEVGMRSSHALWLTVGVASALGSMIRQRVRVLAIRTSPDEWAEEEIVMANASGSAIVEVVSMPPITAGGEPLEHRLADLLHDGEVVFLHLPNAPDWMATTMDDRGVLGTILLSRASHTRKTTVEAVRARLEQLGIPLIGAVLLDREYPIPEKLYRLL
jgi:hypothetical protein